MKRTLLTITTLAASGCFLFAQEPTPAPTQAPATTPAATAPAGEHKGAAKGEAGRPKHDPAEAFNRLDTNHDGKLSLEEFKARPMAQKDPARADEVFKKKDTNNDGSLTLEEFSARLHLGKKKAGE